MPRDASGPLAATLARVAALDEYLCAAVGADREGCGWFPATDLCAPGSPRLDEALAWFVARYPGAERRVAGAFFIGSYVWYVAGAAIAAYLAERRAPDLAPEHVALRLGSYTWREGDASGEGARLDVRFLSERFAALPGDAAASHPDALPQRDAAALRDWLRARLEQHLAPLVESIYGRTRLGARAQWNIAADSIASFFLHIGEALGEGERAREECLAFIKAPGSPLRNAGTGYITLEHQGHCDSFVRRAGCCLYYKVEPGNNCSTCVLRPEAERRRILLEYMAGKYAPAAGA